MAFHEVRFPDNISRGARGGPERRTQVVELASGDEERNASWARSASSEVTRSRKFSLPVFTNWPTAFSADWKVPTRLWPISPPISRALLA